MKPEPKARKDGRCFIVTCRKPNLTDTRYGDADAFCSTTCCRVYFGTSLPVTVNGVLVTA